MKVSSVMVGIALAVSLLGGCSRMVKEGLGAFRGGKGIVVVIAPLETDLTEFAAFNIKPFDDKTGTGVPATLQPGLNEYFRQMLAGEGIPARGHGDQTLTISGEFVYYEPPEKSLSEAASPLEEIVARVRFTANGRILGEANCVGRSTTSVNSGTDSKAQGLAKALVKWVTATHPKVEKPKDQAKAKSKSKGPTILTASW